MSYDLYFTPRNESTKLSVAALEEFFGQRKNYKVGNQQAIYQNEDTGVYFIFDLGAPEVGSAEPVPAASLNLNYFRPHVFGLEAEIEVAALVQAFDFVVGDPQDEMTDGEYSGEKFLKGWNAGNVFGTSALLNNKELADSHFTAPALKLESSWHWNFSKATLQEQVGEDVFVPTILWIARGDTAETVVVWGDGIPMVIPTVDHVLIVRDNLAPKKLFRKKTDVCLAAWSEIEPLISDFPIETATLPYRALRYPEPPAPIVEFVKGRTPLSEDPQIVALENVLDWGLVEKAKRTQ